MAVTPGTGEPLPLRLGALTDIGMILEAEAAAPYDAARVNYGFLIIRNRREEFDKRMMAVRLQ